MTNPPLTRPNTEKGHIGALSPSHSPGKTDLRDDREYLPQVTLALESPPEPAKGQTVTTINDLHREAQEWRNRALLAEAQLATLKAEYEPEGMEACS